MICSSSILARIFRVANVPTGLQLNLGYSSYSSLGIQTGQNLLHIVKVCKKLESSFHLLLTHCSALLSPFHLPQRTKILTSRTLTATCRKAAQPSHFIQAHSRLLRRAAVPKLRESDNCSRSAAISAVISIKA